AQNRLKDSFSAVAHRNRQVAAESCELRPAHRASVEPPLPLRLIHRGQPVQSWIHQRFSWRQLSIAADGRAPVPGTDVLADVAAKNLPPNLRPQVLRDWPALLNGQVRNAACRIHLPGAGQRPRGTGVDAARTRSAAVRSDLKAGPSTGWLQ